MRLGFITSNKGKLHELHEKLIPLGIEVIQLPISYPELQVDSIDEVARFGLEWIGKRAKDIDIISELDLKKRVDLVFLEDSGLFIHSLKNFPGVYSKFIFETLGYDSVLKLLNDKEERSAHFESCIAAANLKINPGKIEFFKGICKGNITNNPRGNNGFGFDPIFQPGGSKKTFAEMETVEKNKYSHRGFAIDKFVQYLKKRKKFRDFIP